MTSEEAMEAARRLAAERGWTWKQPVAVQRERRWILFGRTTWFVRSNAHAKGQNVNVRLDARTGSVVQAAFAPR
jgi:hypothetical protein